MEGLRHHHRQNGFGYVMRRGLLHRREAAPLMRLFSSYPHPLNHSAGNFCPCVSGGLGMKVIRFGMNDDRPTKHFPHMKPPGENPHIGSPVISQQRRQIPCMVWMQDTAGIKVRTGIRKALALTACSLMDVESKETRFRPGKPGHLRLNNHAILSLKESHNSTHRWMAAVPMNPGNSIWKVVSHESIAPGPFYAADSSIDPIDKKTD